MKKNDIKNSADMFLYKGSVDLKVAKNLINDIEEGDDEIDLEAIMFHLQQSAEKFLKSLISNHRVKIYKTHDIEILIDICNDNNIKLISDINILIQLNEYAIEGRYAIIHDDIKDTSLYIKKIEELKTFLENTILGEN